jgi:NodT family efflux transporter outer membrane factor (OMF) lipoprotein
MKRVPPLLIAACLGGCMVGPDYHRPTAPVPLVFKEMPGWKLATPQDNAPRGAWWLAFHDTLLDTLETQVSIGNQTLAADEAAFRNAEALVDEARASLYPTVSVAPSVTRSANGGGSSASFSGGSRTSTQFSLEGTASWEIDVWGRIRRAIQSAVATAQADAATLAEARLSEQALLATDYLSLRVSDALQRVLDATVAGDQRALQITKNQYDAGVAAQSDVITAQTQLEAAQSAAVNVGVARADYEHAIALLIGVPPAALTITQVPSVPPVPDIPGVVPATLLERRPDIAAAERTMASQNALIGEAVAAYYPTIDLSAVFGYAGNPLGSLFNTANRVWSLGASATETLFEGGARSAAVSAARATYDQSVATYRNTVLTAFQGVEDQLSTLRILARQAAIQEATVRDAQRATQIALNEYRAGTQPYTTVVTAQNTELAAEETAVTIEQSRLTAAVTLIEDLGGGWTTDALPKRIEEHALP